MDISPTLSLSPTISDRTNDLFDLLNEDISLPTQRRDNSARYGRRAMANVKNAPNQSQNYVANEIIPSQKTANQATEDFLEQSWTSLNVFNRKQKGRLTSKRQGKSLHMLFLNCYTYIFGKVLQIKFLIFTVIYMLPNVWKFNS